jgi:hypothetical protein
MKLFGSHFGEPQNAKQTGLGWSQLDIDDSAGSPQDLREDVTNFNFSTPRGVQVVTGIDKSAMERLLLLADMSVQLNGVFDDDTSDSVHDAFSDVTDPTADANRTTTIEVSGQQLEAELLYTDYALTRAADGSLTFSVPGVLANGTAPAWTTP